MGHHCFHIFCIIYKFIYHKNYCQKFFYNYFTENYKIQDYDTRSKNNLHLSTVNLGYGPRAINFKDCNFWNQLPEDIKNVQYVTTFKYKLKELFYNILSLC